MVLPTQSVFAIRSSEPELMDDPACEERSLFTTLAHFKFINSLFARTHTLTRTLLMPDMKSDAREYSIIDAGCGGGDQSVRIARLCKAQNIKCTVKGIDIDERTVTFARQRWRNCSNVSFETASIFDLPDNGSAADYIVLTNVLHHFTDAEIPVIVTHLCKAVRRGVLIADLERSPFWYTAFSLFARTMLHGGFSRRDGLLSIRKGFTTSEFMELGRVMPDSFRATSGKLLPGRLFLFCQKGIRHAS